jgi:Flp pilus assembly pilin Flp
LGLVIAMSRHSLRAIHSEDRGQDLAEYCLLTALVALVALGIVIHLSGGMRAIWGGADISLTAGNSAAAAPATSGNYARTPAP